MALKFSTELKNCIINKGIIPQLCGTLGTAGTNVLRIYTGDQPANADAGTSGTLLCTINNIGWATAGTGTASFATAGGYTGTASDDGTAGWARIERIHATAGTIRIDGEVGTATTCTFVIDGVSISSGGAVNILSCPISLS